MMNAETQIHGSHFDHPSEPRGFKQRNKRGSVSRLTLAAMFAEWKKLSPNVDYVPEQPMSPKDAEKCARLHWTNSHLVGRGGGIDASMAVTSWSELKETEARFLLKEMREESGDGPAYRARMIARLAQELFGVAWDRKLGDRLRARFQKYKAEDLTPAEARAEIEELMSRIARSNGESIEEVRARVRRAQL